MPITHSGTCRSPWSEQVGAQENLLQLRPLGRNHRQIAPSLGIANSTVSDDVRRASAAGFSWPLPEGLDGVALEAALFPDPAAVTGSPAGARLGTRSSGTLARQGRDAAAAVAARLIRTATSTAWFCKRYKA